MRVMVNGSAMDIAPDTKVSVSMINPLLSNDASYGVGLSVPGSAANLARMGHPESAHHTYKVSNKGEAMVQKGIMQLYGSLLINAASTESIDMDMTLEEGVMNEKMEKTKLHDALEDVRIFFPSGFTGQRGWWEEFDHVSNLANYNGMYCVFECVVKKTDTDITIKNLAWPNGSYVNSVDKRPFGSVNAPFLYLSYVLGKCMEYLGFEFDNVFAREPFKRIVLMNNIDDPRCVRKPMPPRPDRRSYMDPCTLVPQVSIRDLITAVEDKFGCRFLLRGKRIECVFLKDAHKAAPVADWTRKLDGKLSVSLGGDVGFKLSSSTELPESAPDKDIKPYQKLNNDGSPFYPEVNIHDIGTPRPCLDMSIGQYMRWIKTPDHPRESKWVSQSTVHFPYENKPSLEDVYSVESTDACVPMMRVDMGDGYPGNRYRAMPYFGADIWRLMDIVDGDGVVQEEAGEREFPVAFCFFMGRGGSDGLRAPMGNTHDVFFVHGNSELTKPKGPFSLDWISTRGLKRYFYTEHEQFVMKANQTHSGKFHLTEADIAGIRWGDKVLVHNQPYFVRQIDFSLSPTGLEVERVDLVTTRVQEPKPEAE